MPSKRILPTMPRKAIKYEQSTDKTYYAMRFIQSNHISLLLQIPTEMQKIKPKWECADCSSNFQNDGIFPSDFFFSKSCFVFMQLVIESSVELAFVPSYVWDPPTLHHRLTQTSELEVLHRGHWCHKYLRDIDLVESYQTTWCWVYMLGLWMEV